MKILVLRGGVHGTNASGYATQLRQRLPNHEVVHARTPDEERAEITDAVVATGTDITADLLDHAEELRLFAGAYAGHGHLPIDALEAHGVGLTNAVGVHAPNIGEYVLGALLSHIRGFQQAYRQQERAEWQPISVSELAGSTVTIVGLGNIGQAVATRLDPFDVETIGIRASPDRGGPADTVLGPDELHDALAVSKAVVLACPLTDATRGLIGEAEFTTMPAESILVNVARGPVVDTDALLDAVRHGNIGGATLDVTDPEPLPPEHPLWTLSSVQITPHNAGSTPHYYERLADLVARNLDRVTSAGWDTDLDNVVIEP
ncbi:MAG: D-2-hydroxyacid dehydrogenase [Halobacteriales archaeon]|nr:D-2-hydroxyacid dehydrogenase [Halobacteriales archaeon]